MTRSLRGFEAVFGQAEGALEASVPCALLPFTYFLQVQDDDCLRLQITDFHSNTWQTVRTSEQLEDLRDEVGIGGTWSDFLNYMRDAFLSNNVKLLLGGPASSVGGHGATSAKVITQKEKGTPRVSMSLEKLASPFVEDTIGNIAFELFKAFKHQSSELAAEKIRTSQLSQLLAAEQEKLQKLQQQIDASSFTGKKRGRGSSQLQHTSLLAGTSTASQYGINSIDPVASAQTSAVPGDSKGKTTSKATVSHKAHIAHARRSKQRGTRLADVDEE
eukprot:c24421_g1_i1 orf=174-995(+)